SARRSSPCRRTLNKLRILSSQLDWYESCWSLISGARRQESGVSKEPGSNLTLSVDCCLLTAGTIMPIAPSAQVHPTAILSPEAEVAEGVQIGPYTIVEGAVQIGPGCIIRPHACLSGPLTMGRENQIFSGAVLGERPQHLKYQGEPTRLEIGDRNIFREGVTVHRGTTYSWITRIGNDNYFMANSHVAHDCEVGNRCIFANGAVIGGHCSIGDSVILSGNCAVHQFVRVGRLALLSGCSVSTKDISPFMVQQGFDNVVNINVVGL